MPTNFILDLQKDQFESITKNKDKNSEKNLKLTLPVEIALDEEELEILIHFIQENTQLEFVKINLPGSFNFKELLTDELSNEKVPNLKITIQEKLDSVTTTSFNEFS